MPPPHPPPGSIPGYLQYGGRGRGSSANHPPPPLRYQYLHTTHTTQLQGYLHNCKDTYLPTHNNSQQHTTTHNRAKTFVYIKLPMYLLFTWRLYLMVLRHATLTFLGPNSTLFARCHFRAQKSLDFQGPPLPMPLVMMLHNSKPLCTAPYKYQVH
jgi:hypothetical protein